MTTRAAVEGFLARRKLAVVGVSRSGKGFGNMAAGELRAKGYEVFAVNPNADGCYPDLKSVPGVEAALVVVPPSAAVQVVKEAAAAGIKHLWLQQGAQSDAAVRFCAAHGINVVAGECILMYAQPHGIHKLHGLIWKIAGKAAR